MTKHIQQRSYADCGVACIAMAAGVDYERVLASVAPDCRDYGLYWGEVLHALKKITKREWKHEKIYSSVLFRLFAKPTKPTILYLDRINYDDPIIRTHYVYIEPVEDWDNAWFCDPTKLAEITLTTAQFSQPGEWKVLAAIYEE